MKITNIKIDDFGCISKKSFDLSSTFNLVVGDNESGKSTLLAFIKFIFYGLPRKTQENQAERERSFSWRDGTAAGSITFTVDSGKTYTVERRVSRRMGEKRESISETLRIVDESTGEEVHSGSVPGELFLGVPVSVFESTCFIRQAGVTNIDGGDVGSALENILMSADESIDLQKSLDKLDASRKLLLHKNGKGGSLYELECQVSDLSERLEGAKTDYINILAKTDEVSERKRETLEKRRELDKLDDIFAAISKAAQVRRFDTLHECESELISIENEFDSLCKSNASGDGFLPNAEYVASLIQSHTAYTSASEEYDRALSLLNSANAEKEAELGKDQARSPLSADEIRDRGGVDKICGEIENLFARSKKKKKAGTTLWVTFGALLAAGGAAAVVFMLAGIGLIAISALLAILGATSLSASKKAREKANAKLTEFGFEDVEALRAALLLCLEKEDILRSLDSKIALARSTADLRKSDLEQASARAASLIEKWKKVEIVNIDTSLSETEAQAREFVGQYNATAAKIAEMKSRIASLKSELDGINEADLRARVPAVALEAYERGDESQVLRKRKFCSEALRAMNERAHEAEKELMRLENESENPARLSAMLEEARKKYENEKFKLDAIVMAADALSAAGNSVRNTISPQLRATAEKYMSALTEGKYRGVGIGGDYSMTAKSDAAGSRAVDLLSAGTKDSAYISLRLALLEVIFQSEIPFLAVDEALAQLDDRRAAAALRMLTSYCENGGQCILFTCHSREEKLLEDIAKTEIIRL